MQPHSTKQTCEKESMDRDGFDKSPITLFLSKVSQRMPTKSNVLARVKEALQLKQPYYEPWFEDKMKLCFLIKNKRCLPSGGKDKNFLARYLGQHFSYNQIYKSWKIADGYDTWYARNINYEGDDLGLSKEHLLYFKSALNQERYNEDNDHHHTPDASSGTTVSTNSANLTSQAVEIENTVATHSSPLIKHQRRRYGQSNKNTGMKSS